MRVSVEVYIYVHEDTGGGPKKGVGSSGDAGTNTYGMLDKNQVRALGLS